MASTAPALLELPHVFGSSHGRQAFAHAYSNLGKAVRTKVALTHHMISLLQEGAKDVRVAEQHERLDASRLFLLAACTSIMSEHSIDGRPMRSVLLFFSPDWLTGFCLRHGCAPQGPPRPLAALPHDAFTRHFARSIELLGPAKLNADEALLHAKLEEILLYLRARHPQAFAAFLAAATHDAEHLSLRYVVAQHEASGLSIAELAFLCNMSASTFKRRFTEAFGMAPGQYFHERRMLRAKMLLDARKRPSDIYHELGYGTLAAFSAEFKKRFGVSPKAYAPAIGPMA